MSLLKTLICRVLTFGLVAIGVSSGVLSADFLDFSPIAKNDLMDCGCPKPDCRDPCNPGCCERGPRGQQGPRGCKGDRGKRGPRGRSFRFPRDEGQSIIFNSTLNVALTDVGTTVTPFVVRPDGEVIPGTTVTLAVPGPLVLSPIEVEDPPFGNYQYGLQVVNGVAVALTSTIISRTVTSTRDASTTVLTPLPTTIAVGAVGVNTQSQQSVAFGYGPAATDIP